jgi:nitrate reductase NapE component
VTLSSGALPAGCRRARVYVDWLLGGDMKFLLLVLGLSLFRCLLSVCLSSSVLFCVWLFCVLHAGLPSAKSGHCIWCMIDGDHRRDYDVVCSINREAKGSSGRINDNLFAFIPSKRIIIDDLHCFSAISNRVFDGIISFILARHCNGWSAEKQVKWLNNNITPAAKKWGAHDCSWYVDKKRNWQEILFLVLSIGYYWSLLISLTG